MCSQYQYWDARQGPEVKYVTGQGTFPENYIAPGGEPMTINLSGSSIASSAVSSTFSNTSWQMADTPITSCADAHSPQEFELTESWVLPPSLNQDFKSTSKSLGWTSPKLFDLYKFVVPKGEEAHFELLAGAKVTSQTPAKIFLDQPAYPQKNLFPCCYPLGCAKKKDQDPFGRAADLERHYKNVHADIDQQDEFYCDHGNGKCTRHTLPFKRKDHYRDHLKDFHKEDIGSAKRGKYMTDDEWEAEKRKWATERLIFPRHWRCVGCLTNNIVAEVGWECADCKKPCESERQAARNMLAQKSSTEHTEYEKEECSSCSVTGYPGYIYYDGGWVYCSTCVVPSMS